MHHSLPQARDHFATLWENTTRIALLLLMPKTNLNAVAFVSLNCSKLLVEVDRMTQGMEWLLIAWGIVTGILLILLFYAVP